MTPEDLALQNKVGNTALCFAAISGIKKIAVVMVNKNKRLQSFRSSKGATPLCMAALLGHREMVWYLYSVTDEENLKEEDRTELLVAVINAGLYDVALDLIKYHPERRDRSSCMGSEAFLPLLLAILNKKLMHLQALKLVKQLWEQVLLLDD